jgi:two-component system, chemotaxis family, protein-glutamate methylesterase/glutaminase
MASDYTTHNGEPHGVVAVGASAGGVEALTEFASGLPADLPYAILVVLHVPANAPSVLAQIIDRSGPLPAVSATDDAPLEAGRIYVAVPDRHLLVDDHRMMLAEGPTESGYRPAINALFRSVALTFGPRAVGVLLSGVLDDGVLGTAAIRSRGGTTVVQRPDEALFPGMPRNAIHAGVVDHQVKAAEVGGLLVTLAGSESEEPSMERDLNMELENRIAMAPRFSTAIDGEALGPPSGYTCPDCNGSLMTLSEKHFRCHVGHAWTADALLKERDNEVECALWVALRSLQEKVKLSRKLVENVGPGAVRQRYSELADEAEHAMWILGKRLSETTIQTGTHGGQ